MSVEDVVMVPGEVISPESLTRRLRKEGWKCRIEEDDEMTLAIFGRLRTGGDEYTCDLFVQTRDQIDEEDDAATRAELLGEWDASVEEAGLADADEPVVRYTVTSTGSGSELALAVVESLSSLPGAVYVEA